MLITHFVRGFVEIVACTAETCSNLTSIVVITAMQDNNFNLHIVVN